jgi:hypothetical protein
MRFSAARLTLGAAAWIALGAAVFLLSRSEQQIISQTSALRAFDQHAREASDALADLRAAQQAYVAAGQGVAFWMPKVAATAAAAATALELLRQSASPGARTALDEATATTEEFGNIDRRARDYLKSGEQLMAADVIFTEGGDAAATAARQVETARLAEHQASDVSQAATRKQQAVTIAAAAALAGVIVLALIPMPRSSASSGAADTGLSITPHAPLAPPPPVASATVLKAAAALATDFGRLRDLEDLRQLLGRSADMMDASGLMVWIGNAAGADLRPALAHGYNPQMIERLPPVPRSGDNAAAAAYRLGTLQIVLSHPGSSSGAVVAPILSPDGCIGALSAEIRGGGETSEAVQAVAVIVAAHLAGVLASAPAEIPGTKAAQA